LEAFCANWDYESPGWFPLVQKIKELYSLQIIIEGLGLTMKDIKIITNNEDHGVCAKEKIDALNFFLNYIKTYYL
jgi:hypothetical protein